MTRRIKLTIQTPESAVFSDREVFRVRIAASDAENMPNEVFGYQKTLIDPHTGLTQDEFSFVASAFDLSTYPSTAPQPGQLPAYFRKSTIDVLMPGLSTAQEFIAQIEAEVSRLIYLMNRLDELTAATSVWIPSPPDITPPPVIPVPPDEIPPDEIPSDESVVSDESSLFGG